MIGEEGQDCCNECFYKGDGEVDAEYTCTDCNSNLCFDHMKVWPQPKWENTKPIHYCTLCYQHEWKVSA